MIGILIYTIALGILIYASIEDVKTQTVHDAISILIFLLGIIALLLDIQPKISSGILTDMFLFETFTSDFTGRIANLINRISGILVLSMPVMILNLIVGKIVNAVKVKPAKDNSSDKFNAFSREEKSKEMIGGGDILLCVALGFLLGYYAVIKVMIYGMISSGLFATAGLLTGKLKKDDTIPLVPFITFGFAIFLIAQIKI